MRIHEYVKRGLIHFKKKKMMTNTDNNYSRKMVDLWNTSTNEISNNLLIIIIFFSHNAKIYINTIAYTTNTTLYMLLSLLTFILFNMGFLTFQR